jgi:hypothetical protein
MPKGLSPVPNRPFPSPPSTLANMFVITPDCVKHRVAIANAYLGPTALLLLRMIAPILLMLSFSSLSVDAQGVEIVPGLRATGGFGPPRVGTIPIAYSKQFNRLGGPVQCWTRLFGNGQSLEFLAQPGILPLHHHWARMDFVSLTTITTHNVGEEERARDPNWLLGFVQLLRN